MRPKDTMQACPFCGGESIELRSDGFGQHYAICQSDDPDVANCGARTGARYSPTIDVAIRRWNCRPYAGMKAAKEAV